MKFDKIVSQKKIWVPKNFEFWIQQNFRLKENFWYENILSEKKFSVEKYFCTKNFGSKKLSGP